MTATVRTAGLKGYANVVAEMGGNPTLLCTDCGLELAWLDQEDALIPYRQLVYLMEHTASSLSRPDFGLALAASQDIGILGPLSVAMQNSETVEEAMRCAANNLFFQSPALTIAIDTEDSGTSLTLGAQLKNVPAEAMVQTQDLALGVTHGILKLLAESEHQLLAVELPHVALCGPSFYQRYFDAPVHFDCSRNTLVVTTATMTAPLLQRSEMLRKIAATYLDVQFSSPDGKVAGRVELAVRRTIGTDSCNRETIARAMALHPRTLQRQLALEDESFDGIRDRIRKEQASRYLSDTRMPLAQVAGLLGYAEQSVFTRSCQRWFGTTPLKLRRSLSD